MNIYWNLCMTAFVGFLKFKNCYIRITLRITGFLNFYGIFKLLLYFTGLCFERTVTWLYFYRPPSEGWWKVIFSVCPHFRGGGDPGLSKGKIFDTRFGLIHVQTGKKNFCWGTSPPVKGKIFDTRFGLIHVQTGKKIFVEGPPPQ